MIACAVTSLIAALAFADLFRRIAKAEADVAGMSLTGDADRLGTAVRDFCNRMVRSSLLPDATVPGLKALPVRFRLHNDPFSRVGELLDALNARTNGRTYADITTLIRRFYQLAYTLDASQDDTVTVLSILEQRLIENDGSRTVGRVGRVRCGEPFVAQTMTYLRNGTHVAQPFGFVVYSPEGKVIGRAEVLCR